jgi:adenosylcobinamide kinase/adenosylcobinamide-phosphate guanylyltransferase
MNPITLVIGGCRSGKSDYGLALGEAAPGSCKKFVATCVPRDPEMRARVDRHRRDRPHAWETVEEPVGLVSVIERHGPAADLLLIDCLTLWVSNLMLDGLGVEAIEHEGEKLATALLAAACPVILVTNETGAGIVPDNELSRTFRDAVGFVNQKIAACAHRVCWMVAGIPVYIKGQEDRPR